MRFFYYAVGLGDTGPRALAVTEVETPAGRISQLRSPTGQTSVTWKSGIAG